MVENGPSGGARPLLPGESHDEFLELCALSTVSVLGAQEHRRLEEHLRDCPSCREVHAQYQALVDSGVPAAAASADSDPAKQPVPGWTLKEAEASLFAHLRHEEGEPADRPNDADLSNRQREPAPFPSPRRTAPDESGESLWRQVWWLYAAGLFLLVALCISLYRTGVRRGTEIAASAPLESRARLSAGAGNPVGGAGKTAAALASAPKGTNRAEAAALRSELDSKVSRIAALESEKAALEAQLRSGESNRALMQQNAESLSAQLADRQTELEATQQRLDAVASQNSQETVRELALEHQIDDLKTSLTQRDQELAREQELLDHDTDVRELMGSRNLYIAEVYDVAKNGDTQKPFGRVFYTRGKSLIFYAYDLDQQPGVHNASTFQAWGRRGQDQSRAVNLGVLYVDNAARKRWVLKADDPKALAGIDAVFVTAEPHGGSSHPSGKPFLFAYLRIEPNHP